MQPSISGVSSQVTKSTGFQLIVSPCTVLSYSILSTVNGTISYTLGDPSFTFGPYQFSQSPNCGYNETVSITGLPIGPYLTHNSVNRNFTIVKTSISDYAFLGVYNATIQSQFMQPNIFGGPTAVTKAIIFQLIVSPCTVSSYSVVSAAIGTINYTLGDASKTFGSYQFSQSPNCGYVETVSVTGLPIGPYLTHNLVSRDFTIVKTSISDLALLGVYDATITS